MSHLSVTQWWYSKIMLFWGVTQCSFIYRYQHTYFTFQKNRILTHAYQVLNEALISISQWNLLVVLDEIFCLKHVINESNCKDWIQTDSGMFNRLKPTGYGDAPTGLTFKNCTFCPHSTCVLYLSENSNLCYLHLKLIGFITEIKSVQCAVLPGSLNKAVCVSSLKG
jgi:hypothetical protein